MQTPKSRSGSSGVPQKAVSPQAARQLKLSLTDRGSPSSSSHATRTPKDRSPKVVERKSPRSPLSEKKRPSRISELESQISKLQDDLKRVKDQLIVSESSRKEAQEDASEVKKELASVTSKLEESQKQLSKLLASREVGIVKFQNTSLDQDQVWQSQLEALRKQHSVDADALASALDEIERLKLRLEKVAESEVAGVQHQGSTHAELQSLKENLADTLSLVETMKNELQLSKESKAQAQELVKHTLSQLEAAKDTVNVLRSDGVKSIEAYNSIALELEQSRARVNLLEDLVHKLNTDLTRAKSGYPTNLAGNENSEEGMCGIQDALEASELKLELQTVKSEVERLKSALELAEIKYHEEQARCSVQISSACEEMDRTKFQSSLREAELQAELKKASAEIEDLKANLMDKETELQGISEENDVLNRRLEKSMSCHREEKLANDLKDLRENVAELKASLMDKETELQNISEENEMLKNDIKKREMEKGRAGDIVAAEVEALRAAEKDALTKLGYMMEEAEKSSRRVMRVTEQLEAAQAANAELEAELRKLKVQSDQWRKAAEAAASMLSPGSNGKFVERTGSMPVDNSYSPVGGRLSSPYFDEYDDESFKKKNASVLKKIGVLWKKPQK